MFNQFIEQVEKDFAILLTQTQKEQFQIYYQLLISYNKKVNLTSITDEQEVYYKHFYDSLTMIDALDLSIEKTLCDMGAGAGFPSIPLKIIYPHLKVTIIDSLGKRINFLKELLAKIKIDDVKLVYDRIEIYAQNHHNQFDLVTARALGNLALILELGIPMLKEGKYFVAYKGANYEEEIQNAKNALNVLKSNIVKIHTINLPNQYGFRSNIVIQKNKDVNGYPRSFAIMKKQPL